MAQIFAGMKRFRAFLLDFYPSKRRASSSSTRVDFLHLSFESVDVIEDLVSSGNLLNRRQCMNLSSKLSEIVHNVQQLVVHSGAASDAFHEGLKCLYQAFEKARLLVEKCCNNDWITESVFQIGNEKDFQSILLDVGLSYHAIYEQAKGMSEASSFQHEDLRRARMFRSLPIGEVQEDQDDLKKRLEAVGCGHHCSKTPQQEKLDLEQRIARYLLLRWECASHQTQADEFNLSNAIMWKEGNRMGTWGNNSYLGSGSSGGVIGSKCMGMPSAAVKFYRGEVDESLFLKEAGILFHLNHPHIIKFFCCGNDEENGNFIAMERMEMNLARLISLQAKKEAPFSFLGAFDIIVQIARGMRYLHSVGVAHRDLKPDNVVVDKLTSPHLADRFCVKLVDFGMSKTKVEASKSDVMSAFRIGTTMYRAPELHEKAHSEGSSGKTNWFMADVYSFAITCAHILSLQEPFKKLARSTLHENLMRGVRPELPRSCPKELVVLLNDCWNTQSYLRPTFKEIFSKLEEVKCNLLRGLSTIDNGLHQVPINFASNQFIWTKVEENATIQRHAVNTCNEGALGICGTARQESSPNMQMEERSCEQVPPFLELDALQEFATKNKTSCGNIDSYINAVGPSQPWKKYVPDVDEVEFVVEKNVACGEPLSLQEASFLWGEFQKSLNLALDSCELQALEYKNLLPLVKVYQHQCKNLVETLEPTIVNTFGRCHKVLDALKNFEIGEGAISDGTHSNCVHSCVGSLGGLAQKLQWVVDLFRKCASDDVHKTALELADLPLPSLMPRWSEFSLAIRDCEWYMDLIQLTFCTLEKLRSSGSQFFLDASFKWSEAKGRMVLQIQNGQERQDQCQIENPILDVSKELEAKDTADLIQQLQQLALNSGNVTKWRLSEFSSKADFEKAYMARFLSSKLSGPIPHGRYLPWTFRMEPSSLKFKEFLDSGSSGMVATHSWLGVELAVKCIRSPRLNRHRVEEEAAILARVQHPNVVRLIGCAFIDKTKIAMLAMELMDSDLRTIIDSRSAKLRQGASPFSTIVGIDICLQIAQGMQHLHRHRILHRDLKASNVLVKICKPFNSSMASNASLRQHTHEYYVVKLADFGLAKCRPRYSAVATRMVGTTGWRAPEVFYAQDTEVTPFYKWPADVYSFAMTCYEVWTGNIPFANCSDVSIHTQVMAGRRPQGLDELEIPDLLKELVKQCWATNANKRPTFEEVVKSLWECKVKAIVPVFQRHVTKR